MRPPRSVPGAPNNGHAERRHTLTTQGPLPTQQIQQDSPAQVTRRFHNTGKPRFSRRREDHYSPEKFRMECVGKTCRADTEPATCRKLFFLSSLANCARDFGCGLTPSTSLRITLRKPPQLWSWRRDSNPRPSDYKSDALPTELRQQTGDECAFAQTNPSDPFQMSGTIL